MGKCSQSRMGSEERREGLLVNRDDIIRIAKEAGFSQILATTTGANVWIDDGFYVEELERFAALVAAAEREKVAAWMRSKSYATGHGDTTELLLKELEWQVAEREREACAKVCDGWVSSGFHPATVIAEAIRARGET